MSLGPTQNAQQFDELLKPFKKDIAVLQKAFDEITLEDAEKQKDSAKELIRKAMSLQEQMQREERKFLQEKAKFDKELGKILRSIQALASGKPKEADEEPVVEPAQN